MRAFFNLSCMRQPAPLPVVMVVVIMIVVIRLYLRIFKFIICLSKFVCFQN
ncbi:hypothetical protein EPIR_2989 [Erwinia piriflorinigrans CFBP 5888]|uniref:Uncharacterized protein n=1 Tax=Erwinia piriflorinigrans CFBP 5888 TaxID=1161919 RepID=V5ZBF4_9GAMM|nr:hypothetical protein EPIR_2989 [Erwinia piriflorinigrans CFBP 5888]